MTGEYLVDAVMIAWGHDHDTHKTIAHANDCPVLEDAQAAVETVVRLLSLMSRDGLVALAAEVAG